MASLTVEKATPNVNELDNTVGRQGLLRGSSSYGADEKTGMQETSTQPLPYTNATNQSYRARRYTRDWWRATWNDAVEHRFWPRVIYCSFGLVFIGLWVGLMWVFVFNARET